MIASKTLALLARHHIPAIQIFLYVATPDEQRAYDAVVPRELYGEIRVAVPGLAPARNFILNDWPIGKHIVFLDDDVQDIVCLDASGALVSADLNKVVNLGFSKAMSANATLWGVTQTTCAFYMSHNVSYNLKFCVGPFFGMINPRADSDTGIILQHSEKEDYERSLLCYERDKVIARINSVGVKTGYYKTAGGMNDAGRLERQEEAVKYLMDRWPHYVRRNPRRKSAFPEILLGRKGIRTLDVISPLN